jgi:putative Holliday junction resolvase
MMETPPGRILAIDYGSVRIGLAVCDPLRVTTRGAGTIPNDAGLITRLVLLASAEGVVEIVVGMPYAPDGGLGAKGEEVKRFIDRLEAAVEVPVRTWDESQTTVAAHRRMRDGGMKRKQRQEKGRVDEMAARVLLEEYLEHASSAHGPATE